MFSIIFPTLKLIATTMYFYSKSIIGNNPVTRFFALRSTKWSMADVFVVSIFMAYLGLDGVVNNELRSLEAQENPINMSVDFILFDAEDNGTTDNDESWCLGSQYWSKQAAREGYKADFGILLDMVGAKNAIFTKESVSKRYAGPLQDVIWNLASNMGYGDLFANIERGSINFGTGSVDDAGQHYLQSRHLENPGLSYHVQYT